VDVILGIRDRIRFWHLAAIHLAKQMGVVDKGFEFFKEFLFVFSY
jgi:hypothetical protein